MTAEEDISRSSSQFCLQSQSDNIINVDLSCNGNQHQLQPARSGR